MKPLKWGKNRRWISCALSLLYSPTLFVLNYRKIFYIYSTPELIGNYFQVRILIFGIDVTKKCFESSASHKSERLVLILSNKSVTKNNISRFFLIILTVKGCSSSDRQGSDRYIFEFIFKIFKRSWHFPRKSE